MTYSIVVTILLIVLIILLVRAVTRLGACEYALEKQAKSNEEYTDGLHDKVCRCLTIRYHSISRCGG